jgi:hypothetical protein
MVGFKRDLGIINHGSIKVFVNSLDYLVDASLLLNVILPLDHRTYIHNDPVFPVKSEPDGESQHY